MRNINPDLLTEFKNGNRCTLMKITCTDGDVYGYTDWDTPLSVDGVTYQPAPGLVSPTLTSTVSDEVSNQEVVSAWVDAPEQDLLSGKFDNADVEMAYCAPSFTTLGRYVFDRGNIGVVQWTADGFKADIQSHMRALARNLNFVFTASCRHRLFSQFASNTIGACTLNSGSYTFTGTVAAVSVSKLKFTTSGFGQPAGMCTNGVLTWTTGNNAGLKHEVKNQLVGEIELFLPTFASIQPGDTFSVTAGCDKTFNTCKTKFNNAINFGGFPHIQVEAQFR